MNNFLNNITCFTESQQFSSAGNISFSLTSALVGEHLRFLSFFPSSNKLTRYSLALGSSRPGAERWKRAQPSGGTTGVDREYFLHFSPSSFSPITDVW